MIYFVLKIIFYKHYILKDIIKWESNVKFEKLKNN
jgi:hypothetical protein